MAVAKAVATAPIRPLAWEPPYAVGAALEKTTKKKKKKKEEPEKFSEITGHTQRGTSAWPVSSIHNNVHKRNKVISFYCMGS